MATLDEFEAALPEQKEKMLAKCLHDLSRALLNVKVELRKSKRFTNAYPDLHKRGDASLLDADTIALNLSRFTVQIVDCQSEMIDNAIEAKKLITYLLTVKTQTSNE
jgi:hypothetical protein